MILPRRTLLAALAASLGARPGWAQWPVPAAGGVSFRVMRKGSRIGTHALAFEPSGGSLTVRVAIDIAVTMGPITLYRYTQRAVEMWDRDGFASLDSRTDDDGTKKSVQARREAGRIAVAAPGGNYAAPADAKPLTFWNAGTLAGPLIDIEDGALKRPTAAAPVAAATPGGGAARMVALRGGPDAEVWYADGIGWCGLRFAGRDGSIIVYERA